MPQLRPTRPRHLVALGSAALLIAGLGVGTAGPTQAATPTGGSLSPSAPNLHYTAGPFAVPNVTGTTGTVDCSAPGSCDDYALNVATPAGSAASYTVKVSVSWPNSAADFDIYLLDSAGREVAAAASSSDPEVMQVPGGPGRYTVRVVPYAPAGQSITADISLLSAPVAPPVSSAPPSGFGNFPAPEGIRDAHNAGEPSLGYDLTTDKALYQSYLSTYRVGFTDTSAGTTASYVDRSAGAANGCPGGSTTSLDPILATDKATGRTIESQLLDVRGAGSLSCVTANDGDTWSTSQGGGFNSGVDHQTLGWGPYAPGGAAALRTFPSELYYCSQDIADASCSTSTDGGTTFGPAVPMYNLTRCGGLHGHVKVAPDGTAYVPNKSCDGHPAVVVSTDNGQSWAIRPVPAGSPGESDPSVGVADDGTVYLSWNGADNHAYTSVSHDRGLTWTTPYDVGAQLGIQNVAFPAAVAGDPLRGAVAFLGTTTAGNSQETDVFKGVWQLYIASTYDGGATWKTSNATGADPVQRGSICTGGTTCGNDRNLLDFIDATVDPAGRVLVGYADGCTAACVTTTSPTSTTTGYRDALATIARQSSGLRMHAANDPKPNLTVGGIAVSRDSKGIEHVAALVSNTGGAAASGVVTRLLDGTTLIGDSPAITLAAGTSQRVDLVWKSAKKGTHTVTAVVDPANTVAESREDDNKSQAVVTVA